MLGMSSRIGNWVSYILIGYVTLRRLVSGAGTPELQFTLALLLAYTLLLVTRGWIARRLRWYIPVYFVIQVTIVQALGLIQPYEDTWVELYIPLAFQAFHTFPRRTALIVSGLFCLMLVGTLMWTTGWIRGLGYGLFYIATGIFFIAYDLLYEQSERARQDSQELLTELQQAHARLKDYADQAEELAAAQEHDLIARELHDSVSQIIFSITLEAQSGHLLLDKDPAQVPGLLDRLQELTSQALSQMRSLISQWRPT
jgi:signal transduction histidine kinase